MDTGVSLLNPTPRDMTLQTSPGPTRSSRLGAGWTPRVEIKRLLLAALADRKEIPQVAKFLARPQYRAGDRGKEKSCTSVWLSPRKSPSPSSPPLL